MSFTLNWLEYDMDKCNKAKNYINKFSQEYFSDDTVPTPRWPITIDPDQYHPLCYSMADMYVQHHCNNNGGGRRRSKQQRRSRSKQQRRSRSRLQKKN